MQSTAFRRGAVAASAVSLALLLSACSGGDDKKDDSNSSNGAKNDTKKSAPAKTQAELDKLAIVSADVKPQEVKNRPLSELKDAQVATSDKPECKALSTVMLGGVPGEAKNTIIRRVSPPLPTDGRLTEESSDKEFEEAMESIKLMSITSLGLGSYEGDGATKAMAELKKAGESCGAGFVSKVKSDSNKVTKVTPAAYTGGDEALAYTLTMDGEGMKIETPTVVVRKGNEIFTVTTISLSGKAEQPKAVADAQLKKLG
ncbi:hypothetical protein ABZ714_17745 [Streptomyces sp. NPDC006798]|uniref:hypothetical protein n=1 Tax=Streptomyces sp. NPDC006798 TaxID=3155462 RepID=UPI0033CD054E